MVIEVSKRYLVFPVKQEAPLCKLRFFAGGDMAGEWDISLCAEAPDFYAFIDVAPLLGKTLTVTSEPAMEFWVRQADTIDLPGLYREPLRPRVHFTVKNGWNNDPNGLVWKDGVWHLFCQYNPCSTKWGNMCWLHAVSRDLLHWEELGTALFPDETGTMFSGCAFVDEDRRTGLGGEKAPLLFYYTAAGGYNQWSHGVPCTQRLAWSDDGVTLHKLSGAVVPHLEAENRDPKVIFCEELDCYVMALYLNEDRYCLLTSHDLLHWEKLQELHLPGDDECPDFFPLTCGEERRWVLIGAHDRYVVGQFTGGRFVTQQDSRPLGVGPVYYAAQTYSHAPQNRRVRIGWHRLAIPSGRFSQQMGVPCELTLARHGDAFALCQQPVKELEALRREHSHFAQTVCGEGVLPAPGEAQDMVLELDATDRAFRFTLRGVEIAWQPETGTWVAGGLELPVVPGTTRPRLRIVADTASLELFAGDGSSCCTCAVTDFAAADGLRWSCGQLVKMTCDLWTLEDIHTQEEYV